MADALTTLRLLLAVPVGLGLARPGFLPGPWLFAMIVLAIASDFADGAVARRRGTASARGRLFDHSTDFLFVTAGLVGGVLSARIPVVLPVLVAVAFAQYVIDSYWLHRRKELRMSVLGRWNGILYFVPVVALGVDGVATALQGATVARVVSWALILSTVASILDRATSRPPEGVDTT